VLITACYEGANLADVNTQQNTGGEMNSAGSECTMAMNNGPVWL
jgi:hypothetical protein